MLLQGENDNKQPVKLFNNLYLSSVKYLLLISLLLPISGLAQHANCKLTVDTVFHEKIIASPDVSPTFAGGEEALAKYILKNLDIAIPEGEDEMPYFSIFLEFIINEEGSITKMGIQRRKPAEYTPFDKAGLKMLAEMPHWNPAMCNGKKVATLFYLPIRY